MQSENGKEEFCIELGENLRVVTDRWNYILQRKKKRRNGHYGYDDIGYYSRIEDLFVALMELKIKSSEVKRLTQLQESIEVIHKDIVKLCKKVKKSGAK